MILFFVIFDPLMSFAFIFSTTKEMNTSERVKTAMLAIGAASFLSYAVLLLGDELLKLFSTTQLPEEARALRRYRLYGRLILPNRHLV